MKKFWFAVHRVAKTMQRAARFMTMNFARRVRKALPQVLAKFLNGALWLLPLQLALQ
jgi:hypothetical protein